MGNSSNGVLGLIAATAAVLCLGLAAGAMANNLDRRTATDYAKLIAKRECRDTRGCTDAFVRRLHPVSRHKALGKIAAVGARDGVGFICVRQVVIKLDHDTGDLRNAVSRRRCEAI
jgi:hypothetical protein